MRPCCLLLVLTSLAPVAIADETSITAGEAQARDAARVEMKAAAAPDAASAPAPAGDAAAAQQDAMAAWAKATSPRAEHARLAAMAGKWTVEVTSWMEPGGEPGLAKGTVTSEMILGGRWLREEMRAEFEGMPFEGLGLTGFDNMAGRYVTTWTDNMSTALLMGESTESTDTSMTFRLRGMDPMRGGPAEWRTVVRITDTDHHEFEMFTTGPDGKEFRSLRIVYTRAGAAAPAGR
jgi:hypothetical protein